ncbi:MAG TPA: L-threonylcarbamoyladenylate synthase [Puia sp.]|nr:L-threonylcarbamoyladenylate synthase [Puia sp.]
MLLHLHPVNPQPRNIRTIIECLLDGGVIVYPTDTIYGLGCDIFHPKAIERICRIKQVDPAKAQLSFICHDLSDLSNYTKSIGTPLYRLLKTFLPGPYTFILPASKQVPRILKSRKDTIGLRIPDNVIARSLVRELGHPILSSSLPGGVLAGSSDDEEAALQVEEYTDPEHIDDKFSSLVDIVVDGGIGGILPSTIIDCTGEEPVVIRKGLGPWGEASS